MSSSAITTNPYQAKSSDVQNSDGSSLATKVVTGMVVTDSPLMFRNRLINASSFDIWQRGTSFSSLTTYTYTADRWLTDGAVTTVARTGTQNNVMQVVTQAGTGIAQRVETNGGNFLVGQTYTLSGSINASVADLTVTVTYRAGNTFKATIHTATVSSQLTAGTYSKFTTTFTLANAPTDFAGTDCIQVSLTSSVVNTLNIASVQLEAGPVATPFERRPIGTELAACQRYHERGTSSLRQSFSSTIYGNSTWCNTAISYKVTKRTVTNPSLSTSAFSTNCSPGVQGTNISTGWINNGIDGFTPNIGGAATPPASGTYVYWDFNWTVDAEL